MIWIREKLIWLPHTFDRKSLACHTPLCLKKSQWSRPPLLELCWLQHKHFPDLGYLVVCRGSIQPLCSPFVTCLQAVISILRQKNINLGTKIPFCQDGITFDHSPTATSSNTSKCDRIPGNSCMFYLQIEMSQDKYNCWGLFEREVQQDS